MKQRIGVSCVIWDKIHERIVLTKRTENCRHSPGWALPGGGMEAEDNSIYDTIRRELLEEIGIEVNFAGVIGIQEEKIVQDGKEDVFWIDMVVVCYPRSLDIVNNELPKFEHVAWVDIANLYNNVLPIAKISEYSIDVFLQMLNSRSIDIVQCLVDETRKDEDENI